MTTEIKATAAATVTAEAIAEAQARGFAEGKIEGAKAGAQDERTRVAAILTHAEAEGRRALAEHLGFKTESTIEQAAAMLAAAPKSAAPVTNMLAAAMGAIPNPKVGADGELPHGSEARPAVISPGNLYALRRKQAGHSAE